MVCVTLAVAWLELDRQEKEKINKNRILSYPERMEQEKEEEES